MDEGRFREPDILPLNEVQKREEGFFENFDNLLTEAAGQKLRPNRPFLRLLERTRRADRCGYPAAKCRMGIRTNAVSRSWRRQALGISRTYSCAMTPRWFNSALAHSPIESQHRWRQSEYRGLAPPV